MSGSMLKLLAASGRHGVSALFLVLTVAFLGGCSKGKLSPTAPTWDVSLHLPLLNRTQTLQEFVDQNPDALTSDPNKGGLLIYAQSDRIGNVRIGSDVRVTGKSSSYGRAIGEFSVSTSSVIGKLITLGTIAPQLGALHGLVAPVPPFSFQRTNVDLPPISDYQEVNLTSGLLLLRVINRLPIPIDTINLRASDTLGTVLTMNYTEMIPPGDSAEVLQPLGGRTYYNHFYLDFGGHSPGSTAPVRIDTSEGIVVEAQLQDVRASYAIAKIPSLSIDRDTMVAIDDSMQIQEAEISSGSLSYRISNETPLPFTITTRILGFTKNGVPFQEELFVDSNSASVKDIDLSGWTLQMPDGKVQVYFIAKTLGSGDRLVTLSASERIAGDVGVSDLKFARVVGRIKPYTVSISTSGSVQPNKLSENLSGSLELGDGKLVLHVASSMGFSAQISGTLSARDETGARSASLTVPPTLLKPPVDSIIFTPQNSSLLTFLNTFGSQLPTSYTFAGTATINPKYESGSVAQGDTAEFTAGFLIPLKLRIVGGRFTDTVAIESEIDTSQLKNFQVATLVLDVENRIALRAGIQLIFTDALYHPLLQIPKRGQDSLIVEAALIDASGFSENPSRRTLRLSFNKDDVDAVRRSSYIIYTIYLTTTDEKMVQFRTSDYITLKAKLEANVHVASQ